MILRAMTETAKVERCKECGQRIPAPKPPVRVCAKCRSPISNYHKYQTVLVKQNPPRFEFHHRHCDNPESYLPRSKT